MPRPVPEPDSNALVTREGKGRMIKVLVADDEPDVLELCRLVLSNEGFHVLEACSAAECVNRVREEQPHLVLLDWMMPGLTGIEALRMLKGSARTREIPVVMLTALSSPPEVAEATLAGADGYVTKPFEADTLLTLVRRMVQTAP